jgi:hypothetical protein
MKVLRPLKRDPMSTEAGIPLAHQPNAPLYKELCCYWDSASSQLSNLCLTKIYVSLGSQTHGSHVVIGLGCMQDGSRHFSDGKQHILESSGYMGKGIIAQECGAPLYDHYETCLSIYSKHSFMNFGWLKILSIKKMNDSLLVLFG